MVLLTVLTPPGGLIYVDTEVQFYIASDWCIGVGVAIFKGTYNTLDEMQNQDAAYSLNEFSSNQSSIPKIYGPYRYKFTEGTTYTILTYDMVQGGNNFSYTSQGKPTSIQVGEININVVTINKLIPLVVLDLPNPLISKIGQPIQFTGTVRYSDIYNKSILNPVKAGVPVDVRITDTFSSTEYYKETVYTDAAGKFSVALDPTSFGSVMLTAKTQATPRYEASIESISIVSVLCPDGQLYNPLSKACETPMLLIYDAASFELVEQGKAKIVSGKLTDLTGKAIANTDVTLTARHALTGVVIGTVIVKTNAQGAFSVSIPTADLVKTFPFPEIVSVTPVVATTTQLFIPAVFSVYQSPMALIYDASVFSLVKQGQNKVISGKLTDLSGKPVANTKITLTARHAISGDVIGTVDTTTRADGTFSASIATSGLIKNYPFPEVITVTPAISTTAQIFIPAIFTVYLNLAFAFLSIKTLMPAAAGDIETVSGTLVDATTLAGIPNAPITLYQEGKVVSSAKTIGDGSYSFKNVKIPEDALNLFQLCAVGFDGKTGDPQYDAIPALPVLVFVFKPTSYIGPDLYNPFLVEKPFINSGEVVRVSGKMTTFAMTGEMGGIVPTPVPPGEPISIDFGGVIPPVTVSTGSNGQFSYTTPAIVTNQLLSAVTVRISYVGKKYIPPIVLPATVIIYKAISLGGAGGVIPFSWEEVALVGGVVIGGVVIAYGANEIRKRR